MEALDYRQKPICELTPHEVGRLAYQSLFEFPPNVRLDVIAITLEEGEERRAHVRYLRGISLQEVS